MKLSAASKFKTHTSHPKSAPGKHLKENMSFTAAAVEEALEKIICAQLMKSSPITLNLGVLLKSHDQ